MNYTKNHQPLREETDNLENQFGSDRASVVKYRPWRNAVVDILTTTIGNF